MTSIALFDRLPGGLVEPLVRPLAFGQGQLLLADDDQMGRGVGLLQHRRPVLADQLRGVAPRHAGQLAHKRHALALKNSEIFVGVCHSVHVLKTIF